ETNVKFCLCWRSSGEEQLPCKQWVGGSNPPASASQLLLDSEGFRDIIPVGSGRYPSGQRGQTVNLLAYAFGGSNPPLPTTCAGSDCLMGGNSSAVERQPSKLGVAGSNPVSRSNRDQRYRGAHGFAGGDERWGFGGHVRAPKKSIDYAHVAQSAERVLGKDEVSGSIPDMGSIALEKMVAVNGGQ